MSGTLPQTAFGPNCGDHNTCKDLMAESTLWWLLTGTAVGVELLTGTFYLLMLAIGLAAAAIAAHLGASFTVQIVVAAVVSAGTVLACANTEDATPQAYPPMQTAM